MIPSTTAETIPAVDDHESMCELIEVILGRAGYRVLTATNGADALRLARATPQIDLLVSDIEMPRMRGDELAARFAAVWAVGRHGGSGEVLEVPAPRL
ncbi:MAG: response regulator [Chthoniobacteraceae bacterium]